MLPIQMPFPLWCSWWIIIMFTSSGTHNDFKPKTNQIDKHYSISFSSLLYFCWSLNKIVHDDQVTKLIWTFPIKSLHITNPSSNTFCLTRTSWVTTPHTCKYTIFKFNQVQQFPTKNCKLIDWRWNIFKFVINF
jgi:hypothetical protein